MLDVSEQQIEKKILTLMYISCKMLFNIFKYVFRVEVLTFTWKKYWKKKKYLEKS